MTSIHDIGRSGLLAYRQALAITAENITNVNTEGYRRRDISTTAAGGSQATPVTQTTLGQGVSMSDIRRAFDALAAERARTAQGGHAAAETHLAGARAIETLMIPGDDGIDGTLRAFFDNLSRLAGNPTDLTTRTLALRAGEAVTEAVSGLAQGMLRLRGDMLAQAQATTSRAQAVLQELGDIAQNMAGTTSASGLSQAAVHPLADRRDALLDELSRYLPISVKLEVDGRPTVSLGSASGPLLLQGGRSALLSVSAPDQLTLHLRTADGQTRETRLLNAGQIGGHSRAIGALDLAAQELDAFARDLAGALNPLHRKGIDLTGQPGGDLMRMDGWNVRIAPSNGGMVNVAVRMTQGPSVEPVELRFDGAAQLWRAFDTQGSEIASGSERLFLPGAVVDLAGRAVDGDRIALDPRQGRALDLRMAIDTPERLAAASAFAATPGAGNAGGAVLSATLSPSPMVANPPPLTSGVAAVPAGALGVIPAGSDPVRLANLGQAARVGFPAPAAGGALQITLDGQTHEFDLTSAATIEDRAEGLRAGTLTSATGQTLASLGLLATVDQASGALVLSRPVGAAFDAQIDGVAGLAEAPVAAEGTVQVITRNGRHVAGSPLTPDQIAALIRPENGFAEGAVYDPSPLIAGSGSGYRGTGIEALGAGLERLTLPSPALTLGAAPLAAAPARSLTLVGGDGPVAVELPEGASARLVADRIAGALPGLQASAQTGVILRGFTAGPVSFSLTGANGAPLQVSANLTGAQAAPLVQAINALTPSTGIRAEVSPDGGSLLLVQPQGHDITLGNLVGGPLESQSASPDGQTSGAAQVWTTGQTLRQSGQVALSAPASFDLLDGASAYVSQMPGQPRIGLDFAQAGHQVRLSVPDAGEQAQTHRISIDGRDHLTAIAAGTPAAQVAGQIVQSLRATAPDARLVGSPLAQLPPEGSLMMLRVDGADYALRMSGGQPLVTGPEAGRVSARFDAQNRLVIEAPGITDGRGIQPVPDAAFGFGPGAGELILTGKPPRPGSLPASLSLGLDGQTHGITLTAGGASADAGFPGTASRDPVTGALVLSLPLPADTLRLTPSDAAGFGGPGVALRLEGDRITLSRDTAPIPVSVATSGAFGQQLTLSGLPPEDLLVLGSGAPALRLDSDVPPGPGPMAPGDLRIEVVDAATGLVALTDRLTGHRIAEGALDPFGRAQLGQVSIQLTGQPATGDSFALVPTPGGSSNSDTALAMAALRLRDPVTGSPGLTDRFARIQADTGIRAAAAGRTEATARTIAEASAREQAAIGAVDLDREAARLLELQQAYQASAQTVSVAKDLFETILRMI